METPREEWRPIVGFEGFYEVSSLGRVRSFWDGKVKLLKPMKSPNGYSFVNLCDGNKRKASYIHALVASAFVGPRPAGSEVSHKDGRKRNNAVSNICYESHSANCKRRAEHGTAYRARGEKSASAKLTWRDIDKIFAMRAAGKLQREIAETFGIHQGHVSHILSRRFWSQA